MPVLVQYRCHPPRARVAWAWLCNARTQARRPRLTGILVCTACFALTHSASAQPTAQAETDDALILPPPGTPGSTAAHQPQDPVEPPAGTPGSTVVKQPPMGAAPTPASPDRASAGEDEFDLLITSRTFVRMFRRRYLIGFLDPGPEDETVVPVYEYASLRVGRLDAPWGPDSLEFRLSGWGVADLGELSGERRLTGDLMDANATARFGPAHVTLGRQLTPGGPSLVTRFDGVAFGIQHDAGLGIEGHGGLSVRPRFRQRREYVLMGSATDSLLRQPGALPDTSVTDGWLAGGRVSYRIPELLDAGGSFHERHERGELDRRWGAMDLRLTPMDEVILGGIGTADLDGGHLVELRGFLDVVPIDALTTTAEVLRTSPALFLSRGSVLSVFSLDQVTEVGGEASYRLTPAWTLGASAYHQWFSEDGTGYRMGGRARVRLASNLVSQVRYNRVTEEELGYHGLRGSLSLELSRTWTATTALQHYLYDQAIRGVDSSTYGSATVEFGLPEESWRVMLGGFATRSPYARLEAEAMARLSIDLDNPQSRRQP